MSLDFHTVELIIIRVNTVNYMLHYYTIVISIYYSPILDIFSVNRSVIPVNHLIIPSLCSPPS